MSQGLTMFGVMVELRSVEPLVTFSCVMFCEIVAYGFWIVALGFWEDCTDVVLHAKFGVEIVTISIEKENEVDDCADCIMRGEVADVWWFTLILRIVVCVGQPFRLPWINL